ncbi:MAG TPA: NTP transferase domain-containing protein [Thermoanaerobaculia bacterium]|nr:NTP transferase domain-containing protein [Thermoanaerobaculia bacterium]
MGENPATRPAPELLIMAAGLGSRFGGLKQIAPVGPSGEFVMDYSVWDAARAGVERVVVVIRREMETDFHALRGRRYASVVEVAYAFQDLDDLPPGWAPPPGRTKPWGTAHAIRAARERLGGPFMVINADDFYGGGSFARMAEFLRREAHDYAMVGYELGKTLSPHGTVARGVCAVTVDGHLTGVTEHTAIEPTADGARALEQGGGERRFTGREPVSMNFWGLRPDLFPHLEESFARFLAEHGSDPKAELYIPSVVDELIRAGEARVRLLPTSDRWFGMTYPQDRTDVAAQIGELVSRGVYPPALWPA